MSKYNKYYQTEDLFGNPYPELIDFFKKQKKGKKILDIGCGQGRNALALARMGHELVGIDISEVGIQQMLKKSDSENLQITGIAQDFYDYDEFDKYDVIIMDSIFHFYKRDSKKEREFLTKVIISARTDTIFCICIDDKKYKTTTLYDVFELTGIEYDYLENIKSIYLYRDKETGHTTENKFNLLFIKKL